MKPISEVYDDIYDSDYNSLVRSMGFDVALMIDEDDYSGDSWVLFREGARVGYLSFGWGSCSGCDALQGCCSISEIEELRQDLHDSIEWFDSNREAADFMRNHDWKGDYTWRSTEHKEFVAQAIELLSPN